MIITHLQRATQHYHALNDFQQSEDAFYQPTQRQMTALANYLVASERQAKYFSALAKRTTLTPNYWSAERANPNNPFFDPIKAILYWREIDITEAVWLAFLLIHVGDTPQSHWHYLTLLYGNHNSYHDDNQGNAPLTWAAVNSNPLLIEAWIDHCHAQPGSFKFGKHRKYESIKQLYQVIDSYRHWLTDKGEVDGLIQLATDAMLTPKQRFAQLYNDLRIYRFGRLAKFEFLSLLGYLKVLDIQADHCYLTDATGPKRGAKLLYGNHRPDSKLEVLAIQTADALGVDYAVFEAALCHWQCHWQAFPNYAVLNAQILLPNELP